LFRSNLEDKMTITAIQATQTDDLAPLAYLGRVVATGDGHAAEITDWRDETRDHGPDAPHRRLFTITGPASEEQAAQQILDAYQLYKDELAA
jgi:hypothetical protein